MNLSELDAKFIKLTEEGFRYVEALEDAQGLWLLCPKCFQANGGEIGTHGIVCYFKDHGVPDSMTPGPGRWIPHGTGLSDLTFIGPGAFSVQLNGGCNWHGFIENGQANTR